MNNILKKRPTKGVIVKASYNAYSNTGSFTVFGLKRGDIIIQKSFSQFNGSANLLFLIGICEYLRHTIQLAVAVENIYCANSTAHSWAKTRRCKSAYVSGKTKSYLDEALAFLNFIDFSNHIMLWEKSWGKWIRPTQLEYSDDAPF